MKYILPVLIVLLALSGMDCRKNPVGPPSGADTTSNSFTFQTYTFGAANCGIQPKPGLSWPPSPIKPVIASQSVHNMNGLA